MENIEIIVTAVTLVTGGGFKAIQYVDSKRISDNLKTSFEGTIKGLFSDNIDEKISSAILMRRFMNRHNSEGRQYNTYKTEAVNVISSLLKKEKCSKYQKTLADSLSYVLNLDKSDFQYANMQNMCLKPNEEALKDDVVIRNGWRRKKTILPMKISMRNADLYMADLSYATINDVIAQDIVFFKANLHRTTFRNCDLTGANFAEAYINGARFIDCKIDDNAFVNSNGCATIKNGEGSTTVNKDDIENAKNIFVSCAGALNVFQQEIVKHLIDRLRNNHSKNVVVFDSREYRDSGQLSAIKTVMKSCDGVIALGFEDTYIEKGQYRSKTDMDSTLTGVSITSPWIHTEIGMACGLELPLLLLHDKGISEGVFHDSIQDYALLQFETMSMNYKELEDQVDSWILSLSKKNKK